MNYKNVQYHFLTSFSVDSHVYRISMKLPAPVYMLSAAIAIHIYLAQLWWYGASTVLESRPSPFGITWRHRSRHHWTRHGQFFCRWLVITMHLSGTVMETWILKVALSLCERPNSSRCMPHVTWPVGRWSKWPHIWNSQGQVSYSPYNFYGAIRWPLRAVYHHHHHHFIRPKNTA